MLYSFFLIECEERLHQNEKVLAGRGHTTVLHGDISLMTMHAV